MDCYQRALVEHQRHRGKIAVISKVPLKTRDDLSIYYTPGVAEPCREIAKNPEAVYQYTSKGNLVAVVTDGSAVLGLGNIGPEAALPVMEGKAILFKQFAGLDAFPICLGTQDTDQIVAIVKALEPTFGGINLEDIAAPRCFEIEKRLRAEMKIPVFHDDQHGTAVVVLAGLLNALPLAGKTLDSARIVISGAGAAGTAITKLLIKAGARNIIVCDSHGALTPKRTDLNSEKQALLLLCHSERPAVRRGVEESLGGVQSLRDALHGADVFIGVSAPNLLTAGDIRTMAKNSIVFAMANPVPEIMPEEALKGGAFIVATGRSDYPNQLNNVLAFPGILKGAMKARKQVTIDMEMAAAKALAGMVGKPTVEEIVPGPFEEGIADTVARAVTNC